MLKIHTLLLIIFITGCSTKPQITTEPALYGAKTSYSGISDHSVRVVSKFEVVKLLCDKQSSYHNEQRLIVKASPVIIVDGSVMAMPDSAAMTVYDSKTPPFDMQGCIVNSLKSPWERIAKNLFEFGEKLIPYGGKYAIAKEAFSYLNNREELASEAAQENARLIAEGRSLTVDGDNNRIASGDGATYDENPGIPVGQLEFTEIDLNRPEPEEEEELEDPEGF